jgi:phage tail sheath gpL-like
MVTFTNVPNALRVPLFYAEVDNSQANTGEQEIQRTLLIGQITGAGTLTPNIPVLMGSASATGPAGPGSMLAKQVAKYRANDIGGELWVLPLADDGAGAAATGTIQFTHVSTANGTLFLNVGDDLVTMAVTSTMTLANLATALAAAINANTDLPVTATATTDTVTVTAKNKGLAMNDIPLVVNAGGVPAGQSMPTALTVTIVAMSGGTTNPSLTTGLANLADMNFDFVIMGYFDTTSLDSLKTFFNDTTGRWSWQKKLYGHGFTAMTGSVGTCQTLGLARNDQHVSILGEKDSLTPHWLVAPDYVGSAANSLRADPGRPVQTLPIYSMAAPPPASRFTLTERNTLLFSGISTFNVDSGGTCRLENIITTYQKNAFGQPDNSYLEVETLFQIMFLLRDLEIFVTSRFGRMKLAQSLARVPPGIAVATPAMVKQALIGHYAELVGNFQAQDIAAFSAGLIVEIDAQNHNRINVLYDPTIMNQLRIFAVLFQFRQ